MVITIMLALNGCGLVYDGISGPPFTGYGPGRLEFGIFITAPALGIMLGLISHGQKGETESD